MKTALGLVTFGNTAFTIMAVNSVLETSSVGEKDIFVVVGKPGDSETLGWLSTTKINIAKVHTVNMGFPSSINDIYDACWKDLDYDALIMMGNDVIAYPHAINSLIKVSEEQGYEWVCAREYDVKELCKDFPEIKSLFTGDNYIFNSYHLRPWEKFVGYSPEITTDGAGLSDVHNLSLFRRIVFDKIGYADINFYPAYYEDNDYCKRALLTNISSCAVNNAFYFHFWSRTFKQGSGGSTHQYFENNRKYYTFKWGGDFLHEQFNIPFGNQEVYLAGIQMNNSIKIDTRENERKLIEYWRSLANAHKS